MKRIRDLRQMDRERLGREVAIAAYTLMGIIPTVVMAGSGGATSSVTLNTSWITSAMGTVVAVVAAGLAIMFFVQKQTSKMVVTLVVGGFLYLVVKAPETFLTAFGNVIKTFLGLR